MTCYSTHNMILNRKQSLSLRHHRYMAEAVQEADSSPCNHKHGAVIVCSGRIIGRGYNHMRCTSSDGLIHNCCTCHAEIAAIRSMGKYCLTRGDYRYWVQRRKVSKDREKGYYLYSSCGG